MTARERTTVVTIHDVAREAGVSPATVSRAFNNNESVGSEYVRKVLEAADKLGYRPNQIARNLRTQRSDVIALIIPDMGNFFHASIARGVEDVAQEAGFSVLVGNSDEDREKEARYLEVSQLHRVAGVILCPHYRNVDISALISSQVPVVAIDRTLTSDIDAVMSSNFEGAYEATAHLATQGWKRIACCAGPPEIETSRKRLSGYLSAMTELGLEPRIARGPYSVEGGARATAQLLDQDDPPDAFFAVTERLALGVLKELKARRMRFGSDVGLITFDDTPWAPLVEPPVSVIEQPAYDIGAQATRMLFERLNSNLPIPARHVELSTRIIVRESSLRQ